MMLGNKGAVTECTTARHFGLVKLVFHKGKRETTTLHKVNQRDPPPLNMLVSAAETSSLGGELPDYWDLSVHVNKTVALHTWMQGPRSVAHLTSLCKHVPEGEKCKSMHRVPECVPITIPASNVLINHVDLTMITMEWYWCHTQYFKALGHVVMSNDICQHYEARMHENALQPALYRKIKAKGLWDAIISSPWFKMVDLIVPLAVVFANRIVCMHLPDTYISGCFRGPRALHGRARLGAPVRRSTGLKTAVHVRGGSVHLGLHGRARPSASDRYHRRCMAEQG